MSAHASERNHYVDLLRVFSIAMVVLGHWLITSLVYRDGGFSAANILGQDRWTQWVTVLFQVIPLFFLAGGYSAAASWSGHLADGGRATAWLRGRAQRLLLPTALYTAVASLVVVAARALGADPALLDLAGWAVALQLWFLPVYLGLLLLTPTLHAAHRRWGLAVPAGMSALGIAVDVTVVDSHAAPLGWLNYLLVWGVLYQLGFSWEDGRLRRHRPLLPALALAGAACYALLVTVGPFPVSLIGVSSSRIDNTSPPSVALLAFALAQCAVFVSLEPLVSRLLLDARELRTVQAVGRANALVMIVYLWHMVPVVIVGAALYPTRVLPTAQPVDGEWWLLRIPWIVALALVLAPLTLAAAAVTRLLLALPAPVRGCLPLLLTGVLLAGYALYRFAVKGFAPAGHLPLPTLGCFAAGTALVLLGRRLRVTAPARTPHPPSPRRLPLR